MISQKKRRRSTAWFIALIRRIFSGPKIRPGRSHLSINLRKLPIALHPHNKPTSKIISLTTYHRSQSPSRISTQRPSKRPNFGLPISEPSHKLHLSKQSSNTGGTISTQTFSTGTLTTLFSPVLTPKFTSTIYQASTRDNQKFILGSTKKAPR